MGDLELPDVFRETFPRARKDYRCCECGERIAPGYRHHLATGKWAGEWLSYRTCGGCHDVREELRACMCSDALADGHPGFGCLEEWRDEAPELFAEALQKLAEAP